VGRHVDAVDAGKPGDAIEFLHRQGLLLHRQHGQSDEAVGVLLMQRRTGVVVGLAQLEPEGGRRPERHRLRQRQRVHGDAGLVHRGKPGADVDVLRLERHREAGNLDGDIAALVTPHLGAVGVALALQQRHPFGRIPVRMNVDHFYARYLGRLLRARIDRAAQKCGRRAGEKSTACEHRISPRGPDCMRP
jgi:hypothetical protein